MWSPLTTTWPVVMRSGWVRCTASWACPWSDPAGHATRRAARNYNDITYATNSELGFDYLRDNMAADISEVVQREFQYCVIDEVDRS